MIAPLAVALLALPATASSKETKWAVWGSSGGAKSGGTSWWVRVQDGATSFAVSAGGFLLGRGLSMPAVGTTPAAPNFAPKPSSGFGRTASGHWSARSQPSSRAAGGASQTIEGFVGGERP
jgi:hypothetical protein